MKPREGSECPHPAGPRPQEGADPGVPRRRLRKKTQPGTLSFLLTRLLFHRVSFFLVALRPAVL